MAVTGGDEFPSIDASGIPTPVCPVCGGEWLVIPVKFCKESYTIGMWGTIGTCYECKSQVTACTPLDFPNGWGMGPEGDTND